MIYNAQRYENNMNNMNDIEFLETHTPKFKILELNGIVFKVYDITYIGIVKVEKRLFKPTVYHIRYEYIDVFGREMQNSFTSTDWKSDIEIVKKGMLPHYGKTPSTYTENDDDEGAWRKQ